MNKSLEDVKKEFIYNVLKEYEERNRISNFCNVELVRETDGNFIKIGLRPQLDKEIFNPSMEYVRNVIGLGSSIAIGEEKFFVRNIIEAIFSTKINELRKIVLNEIIEEFERHNNLIILAPVGMVYKKMFKEHIIEWNTEVNNFVYNFNGCNIPIYTIVEDIINSNIIILEKTAVKWYYALDEEGKKLHIKINEHGKYPDKYDVIVYSLIKQIITDASKIKIIKVVVND